LLITAFDSKAPSRMSFLIEIFKKRKSLLFFYS
jgi:hypothetical protein